MAQRRPFSSREALFGTADQVWWGLGDGDWLEAFTHHPQIGADPEALDGLGKRPVDYARENDKERIVELLTAL